MSSPAKQKDDGSAAARRPPVTRAAATSPDGHPTSKTVRQPVQQATERVAEQVAELPTQLAGDRAVWPGLDQPPRAATKARIAAKLFTHAVGTLPLRVLLPDGRILGGAAARADAPTMRIVDPAAFFGRLGAQGSIGFGESYMAGDWHAERDGARDSDALADVLTTFAHRLARLIPPVLQRLRRWYDARHPVSEENTISGARANIHRHYDLSNDLFALFLDETMTYSSAWFDDAGRSDEPTLADAQRHKIDGILDLARVGPASHLLEIGTGWGALAIRAARERGARVTSLTISTEQKALAEERIQAAGVADRVDVQLRDYREASGQYDAIVSVEMIEAVGERYWPAYFGTLDRLLKPGGRVGLQAITMPHDRMLATRRSYTWIHKYIFPGGLIPSLAAIQETLAGRTGLRIVERRELGPDYARTLQLWRQRFLARRADVLALGFDDIFCRMWELYLAYSEAGFRSEYLGVSQLGLVRDR